MSTTLQKEIMLFVSQWVRENKTPTPRSEILKQMKIAGVKNTTAIWALNSLIRKGFIRKSTISSNKTRYVQLRTV